MQQFLKHKGVLHFILSITNFLLFPNTKHGTQPKTYEGGYQPQLGVRHLSQVMLCFLFIYGEKNRQPTPA